MIVGLPALLTTMELFIEGILVDDAVLVVVAVVVVLVVVLVFDRSSPSFRDIIALIRRCAQPLSR